MSARGAGRTPLAAIAVASLVVAAAGCSSDDDAQGANVTYVALDGSPRVPDDSGVVEAIADDFSTIDVDGSTYQVSDDLQSFSSIDGSTQPLQRRLDQYVHLGLDGDTVEWIAGIGSVVRAADPPVVLYEGTVASLDDDQLALADGTVLTLASGVTRPAPGARIVATIDVERDHVTGVDASG